MIYQPEKTPARAQGRIRHYVALRSHTGDWLRLYTGNRRKAQAYAKDYNTRFPDAILSVNWEWKYQVK